MISKAKGPCITHVNVCSEVEKFTNSPTLVDSRIGCPNEPSGSHSVETGFLNYAQTYRRYVLAWYLAFFEN